MQRPEEVTYICAVRHIDMKCFIGISIKFYEFKKSKAREKNYIDS